MTNKSKIVENLQLAIAAVEQTADESVNLTNFKNQCGTLHCTLGLLAEMPYFQAKGLGLVQRSQKFSEHFWEVTIDGKGLNHGTKVFDERLETLFGQGAWVNLFPQYGVGFHDHIHLRQGNKTIGGMVLSHKELALARLKLQISIVSASEAANAQN
jgi:hypothetical protein